MLASAASSALSRSPPAMVVRPSVRLEGEPAVFFIVIDTRGVLRQSASLMSRPGDIPRQRRPCPHSSSLARTAVRPVDADTPTGPSAPRRPALEGDPARRRRSRAAPTDGDDQRREAEPQPPYGRFSRLGTSARAPNRPIAGIASRVTEPRTTKPATAGARPHAGRRGSTRNASSTTSGASTASCSEHSPAQPEPRCSTRSGRLGAEQVPDADEHQQHPAAPSSPRIRRITPPRSGRPTWSAARRAGSARSAGRGSRGRCSAAPPSSRSASSVRSSSARLPRTSEALNAPACWSDATITVEPAGASTRSSRSRSRTPVQRRRGAPALHAGDRQGLGALGHRPRSSQRERARRCRRARPPGRTTGATAVAVTPAARALLVDREALRARRRRGSRRRRRSAATAPCRRRPRAPRPPRRPGRCASGRAG